MLFFFFFWCFNKIVIVLGGRSFTFFLQAKILGVRSLKHQSGQGN